MLLDGVNHVAIVTDDTERLARFYEEVFDAKVSHREGIGPGTLTMIDVGPRSELNVFEIRRRLVAHGASDGFVTDFGRAHSIFFTDPDGLEGEVLLWLSHDAEMHPPGTPAAGYDTDE